ncbi:uncharacterized protein B0P05DRAFT_469029 [Gilbertella persicaria]|nr:uncharacterized protein B0P05DRAFT_469029 [Gilbertella persicaria]KAI8080841.1 hypothetical protein B0P05DRAFT_469029 [Gilbertella persicaria]
MQAIRQEGEQGKLRLLCRHRSGYGMTKLEQMGCEIVQVDYMDHDKVCQALKDCSSLLFIPENSDKRLKEAECVMKCAKKEGVEHMAMMSFIGVDKLHHKEEESAGSEFHNFKEFCQIEKMVQEYFSGDKHCIVRHALYNQFFYYLAPRIESERVLALPVKKDVKWSTVDLNDICEGVFMLAKKQHQKLRGSQQEQGEIYHKRTYNFVMHPMPAEHMAREISEGLQVKELHFKEVSEDEIKQFLKKMKDDKMFQERPSNDNDFKKGKDGYWSFPIGKFINEKKIETMIEYMRLANKRCLEDYHDDLEKVLERKPHSMKHYFEVNRDQFKRFK